MDLGFRQGGFEIRVMVEWEKGACDTLRLNWTMDGIQRAHDGRIPEWYQKREPVILERDITTLPTPEILELTFRTPLASTNIFFRGEFLSTRV